MRGLDPRIQRALPIWIAGSSPAMREVVSVIVRQDGGSMVYLVFKAAISGIVVAVVSEVAQRRPGLGALIVSLPLVSILAIIWLWRDTGDIARIAAHAEATFWLVLPTLPMFLVFPALLRSGGDFWVGLGLSCLLTVALYLVSIWLLPKFGVSI
jgi:hypothetical protein